MGIPNLNRQINDVDPPYRRVYMPHALRISSPERMFTAATATRSSIGLLAEAHPDGDRSVLEGGRVEVVAQGKEIKGFPV